MTCVVLADPDANAVLTAAAERPSAEAMWSVNGTAYPLAVGVLLPGSAGCER